MQPCCSLGQIALKTFGFQHPMLMPTMRYLSVYSMHQFLHTALLKTLNLASVPCFVVSPTEIREAGPRSSLEYTVFNCSLLKLYSITPCYTCAVNQLFCNRHITVVINSNFCNNKMPSYYLHPELSLSNFVPTCNSASKKIILYIDVCQRRCFKTPYCITEYKHL